MLCETGTNEQRVVKIVYCAKAKAREDNWNFEGNFSGISPVLWLC